MNFLLLILIPVGTLSFISIIGGIHIIHEGHIGVYTRGGALLGGFTNAGLNTMIPIITRYAEVQVTIQTDKVTNIPV
jgi:regulator of protease activity HflC (stomatin/prohibitin superfamily)